MVDTSKSSGRAPTPNCVLRSVMTVLQLAAHRKCEVRSPLPLWTSHRLLPLSTRTTSRTKGKHARRLAHNNTSRSCINSKHRRRAAALACVSWLWHAHIAARVDTDRLLHQFPALELATEQCCRLQQWPTRRTTTTTPGAASNRKDNTSSARRTRH